MVVLTYADLIAGLFGLAGSLVLGWPMITELRDRRHWQRMAAVFRRTRRAQVRAEAPAEPSAAPSAAETPARPAAPAGRAPDPQVTQMRLRLQALDERLGNFESARFTAAFGYLLLIAGFAFLILASLLRHQAGGGGG